MLTDPLSLALVGTKGIAGEGAQWMSAGLEIIPLLNLRASPLKGALRCVLPLLALLCLLWGVRSRMTAALQIFQANLMPCCRE